MKHVNKKIIGIIVGASIMVSACTPSAIPEQINVPPTEELTIETVIEVSEVSEFASVTDGLGNLISFTGPAQKIISLSPSTTEILFAIGAGDRVIGRDSNSLFPEQALAVQDLGGMWDGVPVEDILALEPDLILAGENISPDTVQQLMDVGLVVFWQKNPLDFTGLFDNIRDVAALTGTLKDAETLVLSLQGRINAVEDALSGVEEIPLVFYELDATDPNNPFTPGAGTFISYVISQAKGKNLGDVLDSAWVQISSEELIAQDPDFILLADALFGVTPESVMDRAGWSDIQAVAKGNVVPFDPYILSIPGPRLVDGLEEVIRIIHPELVDG